ncbi:hypothetical protein ACU8KH_03884 [Lachancea thermotolerans]
MSRNQKRLVRTHKYASFEPTPSLMDLHIQWNIYQEQTITQFNLMARLEELAQGVLQPAARFDPGNSPNSRKRKIIHV